MLFPDFFRLIAINLAFENGLNKRDLKSFQSCSKYCTNQDECWAFSWSIFNGCYYSMKPETAGTVKDFYEYDKINSMELINRYGSIIYSLCITNKQLNSTSCSKKLR